MKKYIRAILIALIIIPLFAFSSHAAWVVDMFNPAHDVQTDMAAIEGNINMLKQSFSSATEPTNLVAGQWWADTSTGILKLRNATNTGWQYVWDFTNNLPMGSVITTATASYPGTQLLSAVSLAMGTTNTAVASYGGTAIHKTAFNYNISGGSPIIKGPTIAGTALTAGTIPTNKWGIYVFAIDGSGTISSTAGANNFDTGYVDEAGAIAAIPATPGGTTRLGYVTVLTYSGQPFIGGTSALQGGTGGYPSADTNYYVDGPTNTYTGTATPTPSAYSGVYYVKATYRNYITTPTINLNSLGARTIVKANGAALRHNDIVDGHDMILRYDGTYMVLTNPNTEPPVGTVIAVMTNACPAGYVEANGAAVNRVTYSTIFTESGIQYGAGNTTTTFNVPNYSGRFLRGWDHAAAVDPDRATRTDRGDGQGGDYVGTKQAGALMAHTHDTAIFNSLPMTYLNLWGLYQGDDEASSGSTTYTSASSGGAETRPININVLYCIKF